LIDNWVIHDHLSAMSDNPILRPNILRFVEKIIEPNQYQIRKLKLKYYRRNIESVNTFLQKLDKSTLRSIKFIVQGNFEESDEVYRKSLI
jgi:hypothetical protein